MTASAPWATACQLHRRIRPGLLPPLRPRQLTADGACSVSSHGFPCGGAAQEVVRQRRADVRRVPVGVRVAVEGEDVHLGRPRVDVDRLVSGEEVRGHRGVGGDAAQHVAFEGEARAQRVAAEPLEVELLGWVGVGGCAARGQDLVEGGVALRPEVGGPGLVERVDLAVPGREPASEVCGGGVAEAFGDMDPVLVADVPQTQRRMVAVVRGDGFDQADGPVAEDRAGGAEVLAAPGDRTPPEAVTGRISGCSVASQGVARRSWWPGRR